MEGEAGHFGTAVLCGEDTTDNRCLRAYYPLGDLGVERTHILVLRRPRIPPPEIQQLRHRPKAAVRRAAPAGTQPRTPAGPDAPGKTRQPLRARDPPRRCQSLPASSRPAACRAVSSRSRISTRPAHATTISDSGMGPASSGLSGSVPLTGSKLTRRFPKRRAAAERPLPARLYCAGRRPA
jgi:hypothetical protein